MREMGGKRGEKEKYFLGGQKAHSSFEHAHMVIIAALGAGAGAPTGETV